MAHSAMVGFNGLSPMLGSQIPSPASIVSPPRVVLRYGSASTSGSGASSSGRSHVGAWNDDRRSWIMGCRSRRLAPHRDFRSVAANSTQTRHFNTSFDPSKSNIPSDYNFSEPVTMERPEPSVDGKPLSPDTVVLNMGPYMEFDGDLGHPKDTYWKGPAPRGSFMVGNAYAQRTRLTPLAVPELGATGPRNPLARILSPFPKEEYYAVEMELNYGKEWPRIVWENGTFAVRPGFLQPVVDPDLPAYWLHVGIARFQTSGADKALQAVVGALYVTAVAALAALLYSFKPALLAAVAVSWARNTLSLGKWAVLLALAAADRMYLYWVFLAGKLIDGVLARHAPPLRNFAWGNLGLWLIYLALSPAHWPLLPGVIPA